MGDAYQKTISETYSALETRPDGLTSQEAQARISKYGKNILTEHSTYNPWIAFLKQFTSILVIILIVACILSFALGETVDATAILVILILNALIGFIQENRAERSMEALKRMVSQRARVTRDGSVQEVDATLLVPGDIILIEEGMKIPADARLVTITEFRCDESALTGESVPASKKLDAIPRANLIAGDQVCMVFMGTTCVHGRAIAIVTETGDKTMFGSIAKLTQTIRQEPSPLQKELDHVGKFIAKASIGLSIAVFLVEILEHHGIVKMLLFAVSFAVAAVPEGLPATVTIALAIGMQRMAKRNAIVRTLPAVETLGAVTVICTDKTGTLTKNEMTVTQAWTNFRLSTFEGSGYDPHGRAHPGEEDAGNLDFMLTIGTLCNDADFHEGKLTGDPTEGALIIAAQKRGLNPTQLRNEFSRVSEMPFDSTRKIMTTIHDHHGQKLAFVKGAPDAILGRCTHINLYGSLHEINDEVRNRIKNENERMAGNALRVLAFAYRDVTHDSHNPEERLIFVGLQGMIDPPRDEVAHAVAQCHEAGIRIYVVTGDHGTTARAISTMVGIANDQTPVITGEALEAMNDDELNKILKHNAIFARVAPEHKMRVVERLKALGEIVAVTGDGVNDAPALKSAHIGVAMGIAGTDVSKESSDIVLLDDSFATIVKAIHEGRTIFANITKFLRYLISSNLGEVITIFLSLIFFPQAFILSAIHILWINLATDSLPALALSMEAADKDIMKRPPRDPRKRMIDTRAFLDWLSTGAVIGIGTVTMFALYMPNEEKARTVAFTTIVLFEMARVFNCKTNGTIFTKSLFSNRLLWGAVLLSIGLQIIIVQTGLLSTVFETVPLTLKDWALCIFTASTVIIFEEIKALGRKAYKRKHESPNHARTHPTVSRSQAGV